MKKKVTEPRVKKNTIELLPWDWGVIEEALKSKLDYHRERYFYGARYPGAEHKFRQETEQLHILLEKVHELSRIEPPPPFMPKYAKL